MRQNLSLILLLLYFVTACNQGSQTEETQSIQEMLEREMQNQQRSLNGDGSDYLVEIITDETEVQQLIRRIAKSQKNRENNVDFFDDPESLGARYKAGDKSVVPEIVALMKGRMNDEKSNLFWQLTPWFEDEAFTITEPELIEAVFDNITRGGEQEEKAIQLAGELKLKGYVTRFEKRLLSGESADPGRLFYWLSQDGTSSKALTYAETELQSGSVSEEMLVDYVQGLGGYCEYGSKTNKNKALDLCYYIYNQDLVPAAKFNELRDSYASDNPAWDLLLALFKYGDTRSVLAAENYYRRDILQTDALSCLIRLEGKKHADKVYHLLESETKYEDGLIHVPAMYALTNDKALIETSIVNFEKFLADSYEDYVLEKLLNALDETDPANTLKNLDAYLTSTAIQEDAEQLHRIMHTTATEVATYLLDHHLIDQPVDAVKLAEINDQQGTEAIWSVLELSGIQLWFDAETDLVPADYDVLLEDFFKISHGKLDGAVAGMEAESDDDFETITYEVMVVFNNKGYVIKPEDIGDWYDVQHVEKLLNTILEDNGIAERYVPVISGDQTAQYIFGDEEAATAFIEEFRLGY
ncbi:MAG: hypothetical protein HYZ14_18625 [Bacteroidetes bacterium]|nr:hypothetical protein [Bacteroidota bacterium]